MSSNHSNNENKSIENEEKKDIKDNENVDEEKKITHSLSKLSLKDVNENEESNNNSKGNYTSIMEKYEDHSDNDNGKNFHSKYSIKKQLYTFKKREISGYRTAMGEYIPTNHTLPLTNLAIPTPGPSDYNCDIGKSGYEYSILGRLQDKIHNIGPGPAAVNTRMKEKYPYWTIGQKLYYPKSTTIFFFFLINI